MPANSLILSERSPRIEALLRFIQALLLYAPTLYFLDSRAMMGFVGFSALFFPWTIDRRDIFLFLFAGFVFFNSAISATAGAFSSFDLFSSNGVLGGIMLITGYVAARTLNAQSLRFLLYFLSFEALCTLAEALLGKRVFFKGQATDFATIQLPGGQTLAQWLLAPLNCLTYMSELEPMGLNRTPAITGVKMLAGVVLLSFVPMAHLARIGFFALLATAIIIVNGRATIAALVVFLLIWLIHELIARRLAAKLWAALSIAIVGAVMLAATIPNFCPGWTLNHSYFTSADAPEEVPPSHTGKEPPITEKEESPAFLGIGNKAIEYTGRAPQWNAALKNIMERPFFGHHSVRQPVFKGTYVNNAYFTIVHMHGLIGATLLALFYFRRIFERPARFVLLLPLLLICITDDALFWYWSITDTLAIYILTIYRGPLFPRRAQE